MNGTTNERSEVSVSLSDAQKVEVTPPKRDSRAADEARQFEHQEKVQSAQLGKIGWLWGDRFEKPGNVSAILLIVMCIFLGLLIFRQPQNEHFSDVFSGITSIMTLILGYLFGSSDRK